jgi:uncharacterized protein (TIGR00369 family)
MEYLEKIASGEFPSAPLAALLGFRLAEVGEGRAVFTLVPAEFHYNPIGVVHGGVAATLLDSALGCAVHSTLPANATYTTLEVKVNFIRAITMKTGLVSCEAHVVHVGRQTATAEGRLVDEAGKLYAHGTTTCLIMRS